EVVYSKPGVSGPGIAFFPIDGIRRDGRYRRYRVQQRLDLVDRLGRRLTRSDHCHRVCDRRPGGRCGAWQHHGLCPGCGQWRGFVRSADHHHQYRHSNPV
ncbi:Conjugative transfer protein TraA, partial [Methylomonas fluvii]